MSTRGAQLITASGPVAQSALVAACLKMGRGRSGAFANPSDLGYPDRDNTGLVGASIDPGDLDVVPGATLPAGAEWDAGSEVLRIEGDDVVIEGMDITGAVAVDGNNVTIRNSRVLLHSGCGGAPAPLDQAPCGSFGIRLGAVENRVAGTVLENLDIIAEDLNTANDLVDDPDTRDVKVDHGVRNNGDFTVQAKSLFITGFAGAWKGMGTIRDSYLFSQYVFRGDHVEAFINGGEGDPTVLDHCTILCPLSQTAAVSLFDDFGPIGPVIIKHNLMAGGGYVMYGGAKNDPENVLGPVRLEGNRFARSAGASPDSHGYWPNGGTFGLFAEFNVDASVGGGNFWDDDHSAIDSPGGEI